MKPTTNIKAILTGLLLLAFTLTITTPTNLQAGSQEFRARVSGTDQSMAISDNDIAAEIKFGREVAAHILGRYKLDRDDNYQLHLPSFRLISMKH